MVTCLRKHLPQEITFLHQRWVLHLVGFTKHIDSTEVLKRAIDKA